MITLGPLAAVALAWLCIPGLLAVVSSFLNGVAHACDFTAYVWHRFIKRDLYEVGVYDEERRIWVPKDPG